MPNVTYLDHAGVAASLRTPLGINLTRVLVAAGMFGAAAEIDRFILTALATASIATCPRPAPRHDATSPDIAAAGAGVAGRRSLILVSQTCPAGWAPRIEQVDTVPIQTTPAVRHPRAKIPGLYVSSVNAACSSPPGTADRFDMLRRDLTAEFRRMQQETVEQVREVVGDYQDGISDTVGRLAEALPQPPQPSSNLRRIR